MLSKVAFWTNLKFKVMGSALDGVSHKFDVNSMVNV